MSLRSLFKMEKMRIEAYKVCHLSRRTHSIGAQDIGSWQGGLLRAQVVRGAAHEIGERRPNLNEGPRL